MARFLELPRRRASGRCGSLAAIALLLASLGACGGGGPPMAVAPDGGNPPGDGGGTTDPGTQPPPPPPPAATVHVLATAGRSVSWVDADYSVFSLFPPHAVLEAQVLRTSATGMPRILTDAEVAVSYEAVTDPAGAVNSKTLGKTNFWESLPERMFGRAFVAGQGFTGLAMPADAAAPGRQPMPWSASKGWFLADGIPVVPVDDAGRRQEVPYLRVIAVDRATGEEIGHTDVPVPVSDTTGCIACHTTGSVGAARTGVSWSTEADLATQAKVNVLRLHDAAHGTSLDGFRPTPCSVCHGTWTGEYGPWGSLSSNLSWPPLSRALHRAHAEATDAAGAPVFPGGGTTSAACALCHASEHTSRGAMAAKGIGCVDCHGSMAAVGGAASLAPGGSRDGTRDGALRRPWTDLPRCESCHTGDALDHLAGPSHLLASDGLRLRRAYDATDAAASPFRRDATRFAPAVATRFSEGTGHGGLRCAACHGGAHAEWSRAAGQAMDEALPTALQGHAGTLIECSACHLPGTLAPTTGGPHGMHPVADTAWTFGGHGSFYAADPEECRACHGVDLAGTVLSKAAGERTFQLPGRTVTIPRGSMVGCATCHATHATDLAWVEGDHGAAYAADAPGCASCHGADGRGTARSSAVADRSYAVGGKTYEITSGQVVGCDDCHVPHATTSTYVTTTHGPLYESDPASCTICHGSDLKGTVLSQTGASRSYTFGRTTRAFASGAKVACATCHVMHAISSSFVGNHEDLYENDPAACRMCHGSALDGTSFSVAAADRRFTADGKTYTIQQGSVVGCARCHGKP